MHNRGNRRLKRASEVVREVCAVAAAVTVVHHEGRSVSPRRSERRYHVHSVACEARGVGSQGRWLMKDGRCVWEGVPWLPNEV